MYYGIFIFFFIILNEDGIINISFMFFFWVFGNYIVFGVGLGGKVIENLERYKECVINLSGLELWENVERILFYSGKKNILFLKK